MSPTWIENLVAEITGATQTGEIRPAAMGDHLYCQENCPQMVKAAVRLSPHDPAGECRLTGRWESGLCVPWYTNRVAELENGLKMILALATRVNSGDSTWLPERLSQIRDEVERLKRDE
jgi:hypothetical protein